MPPGSSGITLPISGGAGEKLGDLLDGDEPDAFLRFKYLLDMVGGPCLLSLGEGADDVDPAEGFTDVQAGTLGEAEKELHV
jgi:hypothetical protein